jgi:hypothetical protein
VLAKQFYSLASASLVLPALVFACKQESGGYNYGKICQMEGELCTRLRVWSKGGLEFFFPRCTFNMLVEMMYKRIEVSLH